MTLTDWFYVSWCIGGGVTMGYFIGRSQDMDSTVFETVWMSLLILLVWPIVAIYFLWPTRKNG